jgi:hypothetical protein
MNIGNIVERVIVVLVYCVRWLNTKHPWRERERESFMKNKLLNKWFPWICGGIMVICPNKINYKL